jgi:hypothetical protein
MLNLFTVAPKCLEKIILHKITNILLFFSWLNVFNKLAKNSYGRVKLPPVTLARKTYIRPSVDQLYKAMNTSVTFIVGRNPFERLVSGYRDKILNPFRGSEHDILGKVKKAIFSYLTVDGVKPTAFFFTNINAVFHI